MVEYDGLVFVGEDESISRVFVLDYIGVVVCYKGYGFEWVVRDDGFFVLEGIN